MTQEELIEQRVSWAYGQLPYNSTMTKEEVRRIVLRQMGLEDTSPVSYQIPKGWPYPGGITE